MYLEFPLPSGAGGMAAGHASMLIRKNLSSWAEEHNVTYTSRHHGYKLLVTFSESADYVMFALTFDHKFWKPWTIVDEDLPKKLTVTNLKV